MNSLHNVLYEFDMKESKIAVDNPTFGEDRCGTTSLLQMKIIRSKIKNNSSHHLN